MYIVTVTSSLAGIMFRIPRQVAIIICGTVDFGSRLQAARGQ
jgi:hypothetical protein